MSHLGLLEGGFAPDDISSKVWQPFQKDLSRSDVQALVTDTQRTMEVGHGVKLVKQLEKKEEKNKIIKKNKTAAFLHISL